MLEHYDELLSWLDAQGAWGPVIFIGIYILGCVLLLPGFPLTCGAGFLFGFPKGAVCVSCGATLGAALAFLLARAVSGRLPHALTQSSTAQSLDGLMTRGGWRTIALIRLCPIFPFRLCSYLLGLTGVSFREFLLGTWLGTLPSVIAYTSLGASLRNIADIFREDRPLALPPALMAFYIGAVVLLILIVVYSGRTATRLIERQQRKAAR